MTSPNGKITYIAHNGMEDIFESHNYQKLFKYFNYVLEPMLDEPLPFFVDLSYVDLEALRLCAQDYGYRNLKNTIGTDLFLFLKDLSMYKSLLSSTQILDNYLDYTNLNNLKAYYSKYREIVYWCISRNYSSLYLYNYLYKNRKPFNVLSNIHEALFSPESSENLKKFAARTLLQFHNELDNSRGERSSDELYFKMEKFNKQFNISDYNNVMIEKHAKI